MNAFNLNVCGILGGTFDPVHLGHVALAQAALAGLPLGEVLWLPSGSPGHRAPPVASARDRLAMLRLATAGNPRYRIDDGELDRSEPTYTVHTLTRLRAQLGNEQPLALLLGSDSFLSLPTWLRWRELFDLAHIAVASRPGPSPERRRAGARTLGRDRAPLGAARTARRKRGGQDRALRHAADGHLGLGHPRTACRGAGHAPFAPRRSSRLYSVTASLPKGDTQNLMDIRKMEKAVVAALEDIKARDIVVLKVAHLSPLFERMIIASADSTRQVKALADNVQEKLKALGDHVLSVEGEQTGSGSWSTSAPSWCT